MARAVFFDVDFTLIYPGPTFRGEGYRRFCERHGMAIDESAFDAAVESAAFLLNGPDDAPDGAAYDAEIFVAYTRHIIERMGGRGPNLDPCAREIYTEWAACQHFELYDHVVAALATCGTRHPHRPHFQLTAVSCRFNRTSSGGVDIGRVVLRARVHETHPSIFAARRNSARLRAMP
jgi:hypothetical protein